MVYGLIGLGNMARAILGGMRRSDAYRSVEICGAEPNEERAGEIADAFGVRITDALGVMAAADVVLLAVKPQVLPTLLPMIAPAVRVGQLMISIAAGKETGFYESYLPTGTPIVRAMPNINAMVGEAAVAVAAGRYASRAHVDAARAIFDTVGKTFEIEERLFSAFTALSGSSVAFAYRYMHVLAKAAEAAGFTYETALAISAAAAGGSAAMVADGGIPPETLIRMVCSPGGTTIEGIRVLDAEGFDDTLTHAFEAVVHRDEALRG